MTNLSESPVEETAAPEEAPAETGLASSEEAGVEAPPESTDDTSEPSAEDPPADLLDTSELGEKMVAIKVDGEEKIVPLKEALQGYQRQEDYTRKTQQAAEALRLAQAIQNNPGLTMQALANQRGMSVEQFLNLPAQQQQQPQEPDPEDIPPTDPFERKLWEQDRRVRQLEDMVAQERADADLQRVVSGLKQQYGASDDDVNTAVNAAIALSDRTGRTIGPEFLPMIYQSLQYNKMVAAQQAQQQSTAAQQADEAQRQAAAQQAAATITAGQSANGTTAAPVAGQPMTPAEAIAAALDAQGIS